MLDGYTFLLYVLAPLRLISGRAHVWEFVMKQERLRSGGVSVFFYSLKMFHLFKFGFWEK